MGWAALASVAGQRDAARRSSTPTDPVLATEVQVSEPVDEPGTQDDEARFALTSEAGLDDGLAFPFTYAAIGRQPLGVGPRRLARPLGRAGRRGGRRERSGVAMGFLVGWLLGRLFFSYLLAERLADHPSTRQGFAALRGDLPRLRCGGAGGGVRVRRGLRLRGHASRDRASATREVLHAFVEQIERLLTVAVIVLVGGAVARGAFTGMMRPVACVVVSVAVVGVLVGCASPQEALPGSAPRLPR